MTAVRLRGNDAINRALEVRQLHLEDMMSVQELATHYNATERAIYAWLKLAKKHTLPEVDDQFGWLNKLVTDLGARLEDAKDVDAVRLSDSLAKLLGIGSSELLKQQQVQIEAAKIQLIAAAFDRAIGDVPNRPALRAAFVEVLNETQVTV